MGWPIHQHQWFALSILLACCFHFCCERGCAYFQEKQKLLKWLWRKQYWESPIVSEDSLLPQLQLWFHVLVFLSQMCSLQNFLCTSIFDLWGKWSLNTVFLQNKTKHLTNNCIAISPPWPGIQRRPRIVSLLTLIQRARDFELFSLVCASLPDWQIGILFVHLQTQLAHKLMQIWSNVELIKSLEPLWWWGNSRSNHSWANKACPSAHWIGNPNLFLQVSFAVKKGTFSDSMQEQTVLQACSPMIHEMFPMSSCRFLVLIWTHDCSKAVCFVEIQQTFAKQSRPASENPTKCLCTKLFFVTDLICAWSCGGVKPFTNWYWSKSAVRHARMILTFCQRELSWSRS